MSRVFATLNLLAFTLLGIGTVNLGRSLDIESTMYSLNWFLKERIEEVVNINSSFKSAIAISETQIAQASDSVVPILIYEEVSIYHGSSTRYKFLERFTTRVQVGSGTAFFISSDGYLLTNRHVVDGEESEYSVNITGAMELPARVVYKDPIYDLAIIKVEGENYPAMNLGDSGKLRVGENISTIGNAYGEFTDSISSGSIAAVNRSALVSDKNGEVERMLGLIQTTAKLYPGDSGGPLLNSNGQVIGVNVASALGEDVSFSIPINTVKNVIGKSGVLEI